jgi:hypothetical protein
MEVIMYPEPIFLNVHLYGVMIAIGILCCFFVLYFFGKIKGVNPAFTDFVFYNGIASIAVGFFTANLFQAVYNYIDNPDAGFTLKNSGIQTVVTGIEMFRKQLDHATEGDNVGLLISNVSRKDVSSGEIIYK